MKVYRNGVLIWDELTDPYGMPELMAGWYPESNPSEFSLDLLEVRAFKVEEIRREANAWFDRTEGSFAGIMVVRAKIAGVSLTVEDAALDKKMVDNKVRRDNLAKQAKNANDWRVCLWDIKWTDPA